MTPERWQHIKEIFYGALAHSISDRASFIDAACDGDESVRHEVSQLIAAYEESGEFLEAPAFELAARSLAANKSAELAPGQTISRYKIIKLLGSGGMGEVYLAEDTRLRRKVALKLLPVSFAGESDRVRRFAQEACAASALNHPNVCTIHEVGETEDRRHFIVMEHIDGLTLRTHMATRRMEITELLDVAIQIASGLEAAHTVGVVHRDVKPENVMLRPDGIVKILDFGLAKLIESNSPFDSAVSTQLKVRTETGMVMGSACYMSPEQARAQEVDNRTDIWSLGVVLYEMATGRVPFEGETPSHVVVAILESEPPPLSPDTEVAVGVNRIIAKALRKNKNERHQTAAELINDLRTLKEELQVQAMLKRELQPAAIQTKFAVKEALGTTLTAPTGVVRTSRINATASSMLSAAQILSSLNQHRILAGAALFMLLIIAFGVMYFAVDRNKASLTARTGRSIAVLPIKPIDSANRDELYEIGIADSLIHRLSSTQGITVRPLSVIRKYASIDQDPLAAGKEQQVDYILASNYQIAGGKVRVTAQLFNVASGEIEETYKSEKEAGKIFELQDAIAAEIGNILLTRFGTTSASSIKRGTNNEEAYRLYLQGMFLVEKLGASNSKRAIELFDLALALDPNYAKAWAGKARAHCQFAHFGGSTPDAEFTHAKPALERAFALDNNLAEAYGTLGTIQADYDWDFVEAEKQFLRAIEIDPTSVNVHIWYARRLAGRGRPEEGLHRIKVAIDLNPSSVLEQNSYGFILHFARRHDDAITQLRRVVEMDPGNPGAYDPLWRSYHMKGDYPRAYEFFMEFQRSIRTNDETLKSYETAYATGGWHGPLNKYVEILKDLDVTGFRAYTIAGLSALLGEREQAFRYLNEAAERRAPLISFMVGDPTFDSLRDDPRFKEFVSRVGLK